MVEIDLAGDSRLELKLLSGRWRCYDRGVRPLGGVSDGDMVTTVSTSLNISSDAAVGIPLMTRDLQFMYRA